MTDNFTPCQETVEHISAWCDDASASRIKGFAERIEAELKGMHSDRRRKDVCKMAEKIIHNAILSEEKVA